MSKKTDKKDSADKTQEIKFIEALNALVGRNEVGKIAAEAKAGKKGY